MDNTVDDDDNSNSISCSSTAAVQLAVGLGGVGDSLALRSEVQQQFNINNNLSNNRGNNHEDGDLGSLRNRLLRDGILNCSTGSASVGSSIASGAATPGGPGLNPLNRADAVRRQSSEVVQLAKSDVEELHAKLKSLQEVLTKNEREKMQLEAQVGVLKAQTVSGKPSAIAPDDNPLLSCLDADQLVDALLSLLQQKPQANDKLVDNAEENHLPEPSDSASLRGKDENRLEGPTTIGLALTNRPGFADKLALLVSVCSPLPLPTKLTNSTAAIGTAISTTATTATKGDQEVDPQAQNGSVLASDDPLGVGVRSASSGVAGISANNNNGKSHLLKDTASSSVEQCSAITDRFQEKINKQQETIERLNNALEEVELILEESHAKNATLEEKVARLEQERLSRGGKNGKSMGVEGNQETADVDMDTSEADCPNRRVAQERDLTKEPSSSSDVPTSSSNFGTSSSPATDEVVVLLRAELEAARKDAAEAQRRETELSHRCADFTHQIENLTSQLTELTSQAGNGCLPGSAGVGSKAFEDLQRDNQNLMLELNEVQHALNRLSKDNERLKAAAPTSTEQVDGAEEQRMKEALTAAEAARMKAEVEIESLRREVDHLKAEAVKKVEESRDLEQERKLFEEKVGSREAELKREEAKLTTMKTQLEDAQKTFAEEKETFKAEREALQSHRTKLDKEMTDFHEERLKLDEEKSKSQDVASAAEAVTSGLREECRKANEQLEAVKVELEELRAALEKRSIEVESAEKKVQESEDARQVAEKNYRELSTKLDEMETEISTLKSQQSMEPPSLEVEMLLEELKSDLAMNRSALDERSRELAISEGKIVEAEARANQAVEALEAEKQKASEKQREIERLQAEVAKQSEEMQVVKEQLEEAAGRLKEFESEVEISKKKLKESEKSAASLRAQLDPLETKAKEAEKRADSQASEIRKLEEKLAQATSDLAERSKKVETLKVDLESASQRADELREELEEVREELEKHSADQQLHKSLQVELEDASKRLTAAEARASAAEQTQEETRAKLNHATEENSRIMHELKAMEEEKTSLHVDLVKCRQQLCETTQIKSALEKLRTENADLRSSAETSRAEAERSRTELNELRTTNDRLTVELGKARQEATTCAAAAARDKDALMSEIAALSEKHLKVNAELEDVRSEKATETELAAQLGTQLAALLAKTKEAAGERENLDRQVGLLRNELAAKAAQVDKLTKDLRTGSAHADNLKKQVSKLLLAVAEKEKHLAALHSDNQKLRIENQAYGDKMAGQDALINRIAQLEQDIAGRNMTISKVCAEREDGVRQLEQLRAQHAISLRELQELREAREVETLVNAKNAMERGAEMVKVHEKLAKASEELEQLRKQHDIALSERTIAESRCRSTLNLSRKLEKEVASLQKSKERVANELTESQEHVTYLENERAELLKTFKNLPSEMEKLQTENGLLRTEIEKLRDREHAWAPLVQAGLAKGRKPANATAAVAPLKAADPASTVVPQPKKKTIFARLKDGFSERISGREQSPGRAKQSDEKLLTAASSTKSPEPMAAPAAAAAAPAANPGSATGPGARRRGTRRSFSDADPDSSLPSAKKRFAASSEKDSAVETAPTASPAAGGGRKSLTPSAQAEQKQAGSVKGRITKGSSSTEEEDEDDRPLPTPPTPTPPVGGRRRGPKPSPKTVPPAKKPTPSKSPRGAQAAKNKGNTPNAKGRGDRASQSRELSTSTTANSQTNSPSGGGASGQTASTTGTRAGPSRETSGSLVPKGRRSLIKGTPKKSLATVAAAADKNLPASDENARKSPTTVEAAVGGRSLRASTLVVKKASDIDAKQREQFKHKGRISSGGPSGGDA